MSTPTTPHARLAAALSEMHSPKADKVNPAFKSRYASLDGILDTVRPILAKHSLGLTQAIVASEGRVGVRTSIVHPDGILDMGEVSVAVKPDTTAQQVGSAVTYLRRMSIQASMGIATDTDTDDDGASASEPTSGVVTTARTWAKGASSRA